MRPARLHELTLPTSFQLWKQHGSETKISPKLYVEFLKKHSAIELVDQKGVILCKTLNESLIQDLTRKLLSRPYHCLFALWLSKLVKRRNTQTLQRTGPCS